MTKITHEEYEILKGLDNQWKWIARDNELISNSDGYHYGSLFAYSRKPIKSYDVERWVCIDSLSFYIHPFQFIRDNHLFQFIRWEDSEPYNIADLIKEYEFGKILLAMAEEEMVLEFKLESEETEMKKDLEWVKHQIDLRDTGTIDKDDPQFYVNVGLKMALDFLNQLDEPETLSPDWIGDNVEYAYYMTPKGTYSSAKAVIDPNKLENLLVPKQEKVTVDKEDAENIVDYKEMGWTLSHLIDVYGEDARHDELLAKAWLAYPNIEVEEEQKYFAKIKGHENIVSDDKYWNYCITDESLDIGDNKVHTDVLAEYVLSATKDEWENLGVSDDNADFVKVEELEE